MKVKQQILWCFINYDRTNHNVIISTIATHHICQISLSINILFTTVLISFAQQYSKKYYILSRNDQFCIYFWW